MKKLIIGMSGKKFSGKTTTSEILEKSFSENEISVEKMSFAFPLKSAVSMIFGIPSSVLYGDDNIKSNWKTDISWNNFSRNFPEYADKNGNMSARDILQVIGTDIFRQLFDKNIWVKSAIRNALSSDANIVLFDDCRFPNEADMILENHGILLRLERNVAGKDLHESETALDDYDWDSPGCIRISPEKTLNEYKQKIKRIFSEQIIETFMGL